MNKSLITLALLGSLCACSQVSKSEKEQSSSSSSASTQKQATAPEQARTLDELLEEVKHERVANRSLNQVREAETIVVTGIRKSYALKANLKRHAQGRVALESNTENYQHLESHDVVRVDENPVSTFGADVDTASYANVRRFINNGRLPRQDAVRVEELVNYFGYNYPKASSLQQPIRVDTLFTESPWNSNNQLIRIGVNTYSPEPALRPAANLVFLVDVSGSMQAPDKLPLIQKSLNLLLSQLRPEDKVSLVTYAGATQIVLPATSANERVKIQQAIAHLSASGSTYGEAGIDLAYQQAEVGFIESGINQIFLMSDGDLNVGITDIEQLKQKIAQKRKGGVQFSTFGFGQGNYNDHLMEQLADEGNGVASYIDTLHEAQKLLVDQLGSSLQTVAHDVKFQIEFNPAKVSEYRLIGYENRQLARADFNNDQKDAGDLGAGHQVTVLYEITPVGSKGLTEPLVFQSSEIAANEHSSLAEVRVRYKPKQGEASQKLTFRIEPEQHVPFDELHSDDSFAISVAAWGQKLKGSSYLNELSYAKIIGWANLNKGDDPYGYRAEFVRLARLSESLSQQQ